MSAAGSPPSKYGIGKAEVEVGDDRIVRVSGSTNYAGSALCPIEGIFRSAGMLGKSWRDTWDYSSVTAAHFMGLKTGIQKGSPACFCLLHGKPPK